MQHDDLEEDLVEGLRGGDDPAVGRFIDVYSPVLLRYLRRRCSNAEDAEDVLSMTFQKVVTCIATFDPARGSFTNWVFCVARSCLADFYRANGHERARYRLPEDDCLHALEDPCADPGLELGRLEGEDIPERVSRLTEAVRRVLDRMNRRHRQVLELLHAGLTREEIAERLGVTRSHLRVLISRALRQFRNLALQDPYLSDWLNRAPDLPTDEDEGEEDEGEDDEEEGGAPVRVRRR